MTGDARLGDTSRVEAFSDGVMAIAITLLVLNLETPSADDVAAHNGLLGALLARWPAYLAYLAAFFTVGIIWLNHHALVNKVARFDPVLQWLNLLLLLGVATLPFPTAVLATYLQDGGDNARVAAVLYALLATVMAIPWGLMWSHLRAHPELLEHGFTADYASREIRRARLGVLVYGGAILVAAIAPLASLLLFLGIALFYAVTSLGVSVDA